MAFLDESGLQRFWENIVSKFVRKVDGKDLSSNDYTDAEKEKLAGLKNYTLPVATSTALGGVKSGGDIAVNSSGAVTVNKAQKALSVEIDENPLGGVNYNFLTYAEDDTNHFVVDPKGEGVYLESYQVDKDGLIDNYIRLVSPEFKGDGSALTNLNASKITSGTIPAERLPNVTTSKSGAMSAADKIKLDKIEIDTNQNATFPAKVTATKFIGDGSELTNLPVSFTRNLTSGEKIGTININGTNTEIFAPESENMYGIHDGEGNVTLMIGNAENTATTITPEIIGAADRNHTHNNMTGATTSKAGTSGFVPAPAAGTQNRFLRADGTWQEVTTSGGSGTVSGDYLPLAGGTVTGDVAITATTASTSITTGALKVSGGVGVAGNVYANAIVGAVWNDYAETRRAYSEDFKYIKPGCVVTECAIENDTVRLTDKRLEKIPMVITDTYGFLIGEKEGDVVPVAVAGRVLVNTYEDRSKFELGDAVCSGPNGTVSIMTYEELLTFPDRVLGYVSCIPDYDTWGEVKVNNRIWIKLK